MTSNTTTVYVWIFLPGQTKPVVAGVTRKQANTWNFVYAKSYLARPDALALGPDLPLQLEPLHPPAGCEMIGTLRDGLPDAWGQRVLLDRATGIHGIAADPAVLDNSFYMLHSDSQRFGALDFQASPSEYVSRGAEATLEQMLAAATILDTDAAIPATLDAALRRGTSVGGARPKAYFIDTQGEHWIAKFAASSDIFPTIQIEAAALHLAELTGVAVPKHRLTKVAGKQVLLVQRFDRLADGSRRQTISMLTALGLDEMTGRYASYPEFLNRLTPTPEVNAALYTRVALNIVLGNTDDHARNHAAFWDGKQLTLAPVYDLDPTARPAGWDANQAIAYSHSGLRKSNLELLKQACADYSLTAAQAAELIDHVVVTCKDNFAQAADFAQLSSRQTQAIAQRAILHPAIFEHA